MRPGIESAAGFLGPTDNLIDTLANDNAFIVDQLGLTHAEIAEHLQKIRFGYHDPVYHGRRFRVERTVFAGSQGSPFAGEGTRAGTDYTITNLENGAIIQFSDMHMHLIHKYGFYEGLGTEYRLDPKQILDVLDFLKK